MYSRVNYNAILNALWGNNPNLQVRSNRVLKYIQETFKIQGRAAINHLNIMVERGYLQRIRRDDWKVFYAANVKDVIKAKWIIDAERYKLEAIKIPKDFFSEQAKSEALPIYDRAVEILESMAAQPEKWKTAKSWDWPRITKIVIDLLTKTVSERVSINFLLPREKQIKPEDLADYSTTWFLLQILAEFINIQGINEPFYIVLRYDPKSRPSGEMVQDLIEALSREGMSLEDSKLFMNLLFPQPS